MAGFVGGKEVAITGARIGMNRLQKLVRAALANVIIFTVDNGIAKSPYSFAMDQVVINTSVR
jgi:hypothetical protein